MLYSHIFSEEFSNTKFLALQSDLWCKTWKKHRIAFGHDLLLVLFGIRCSTLLDSVYPDLHSFVNLITSLRQVSLHYRICLSLYQISTFYSRLSLLNISFGEDFQQDWLFLINAEVMKRKLEYDINSNCSDLLFVDISYTLEHPKVSIL